MLTESEAWESLADVLYGYGMPPYADSTEVAFGLCECISMMSRDGIITREVSGEMILRIEYALKGLTYLAPIRKARPRIHWARRFAKESL